MLLAAAAPLEVSYDYVLSQDVVRDVVRLICADRVRGGTTSLVLHHGMEPTLGLLDLEGLGKEIWAGEDAQAYVDRLRDEWSR